jgi:hypothetical protein
MTTYKCPDCKTWFEVEEQISGKLAVEVAGAKENFVFCSRELPLWCPCCEDKSQFRHYVELKPAIKRN